MPTLNALDPTPDQIKAFLSHKQANDPVFMVNMLKFKDRATYKDGEDVSGREAYGRYAKAFGDMARAEGIDIVYGGNANVLLIGQSDNPGETEWDAVASLSQNPQTSSRGVGGTIAYFMR